MAIYNIGDEFIGSYPLECAEYLEKNNIGYIEKVKENVYKIVKNDVDYEKEISVVTKDEFDSSLTEIDEAICALYELNLYQS